MNTAFCAQRIVQAWECFEFGRFEAELESAFCLCNTATPCSDATPCSEVEREQRAVLEGVVNQFRGLGTEDDDSYRLDAGFFLLRHLQTR